MSEMNDKALFQIRDLKTYFRTEAGIARAVDMLAAALSARERQEIEAALV